jgi:DNA-directed RNA polymerase subunit M/transcription elongation factor TFIIS
MSARKLASASPFNFKRTPAKVVGVIETIESILRKINFSKNPNIQIKLSNDDIHRISSISWEDGTQLFTVKNKQFIYSIISMYIDKEIPIDEMINFLEYIVKDDKKSDNAIIFLHEFFTEAKKVYLEDLERSKNKIEVSEGLLPCPKCKSMKTTSIPIQLRGGDEGFTIKSVCFACGYKWSKNS